MTYFEILDIRRGERRRLSIEEAKEKWIVVKGACTMTAKDKTLSAGEGGQFDVVREDGELVIECPEDGGAKLVRMCGRWGDDVGGSGLFWVVNSDDPKDFGDPIDYPKKTNFDRHYHDCDEYWILYEGTGIAVSENKQYKVTAGDCVATGKGHHHDFPVVLSDEPVKAVFFETTMEGLKRRGHLWNHTHGPAEPDMTRV
jgi:mannose-6-phosphate isomerase-like protein (cupin superfamily)